MRRPACASISISFYALGWLLAWVVEGGNDLEKFLYLQEPPEKVFPIHEYKKSVDGEKPAFLFSADYPYPRIVEFYAHWCPHCKHFKPTYIEFGRKLREVTDQLPGDVRVETYAVSCVPNANICTQFEVHGYPMLKIFPAHSVNGTTLNRSKLHPSKILKDLGISNDQQYSTEKQERQNGAAAPSSAVAVKENIRTNGMDQELQHKHFMQRSKKETFDDAHLSFDFLLRHGIFTAPGALPDPARNALRQFVEVLTKAMPTSSSMHDVIGALSTNHASIVTSEEALLEVLDRLDPPSSSNWSPACLEHGTGYTCGLWTLFHIVTVGTVEWNLLSGDPDLHLTTLGVADAIRSFIEHFFQCDDCRAHFLSEYDSCGYDRCNRLSSDKTGSTLKEWKELPLWFYETHNGVNARLRQERVDNKEHEDTTAEWQVQWPAVYDCPNCWLSEGRWDEDQVYRFLRLQYWPEDYKTSEIQDHLSNVRQEEDIHPDVVQVMHKHQMIADDPELLEVPKVPLPLMALVLFAIVSGYAYHRKRKYDMKGYHKKRESESC